MFGSNCWLSAVGAMLLAAASATPPGPSGSDAGRLSSHGLPEFLGGAEDWQFYSLHSLP